MSPFASAERNSSGPPHFVGCEHLVEGGFPRSLILTLGTVVSCGGFLREREGGSENQSVTTLETWRAPRPDACAWWSIILFEGLNPTLEPEEIAKRHYQSKGFCSCQRRKAGF